MNLTSIPPKKKAGRPKGAKNLTVAEKIFMDKFNRDLHNEASRNYRMRNKNKINILELEIEKLKKENENLKIENKKLKSKIDELK